MTKILWIQWVHNAVTETWGYFILEEMPYTPRDAYRMKQWVRRYNRFQGTSEYEVKTA